MLRRDLHFDWANYQYVIFAACFMLGGRDTHIDFWGYCFWSAWLLICPLMREHFLWLLLKRKVLHCGSIRVLGCLIFSKVPIWITESDFLFSVNVMVSCNEFCHAGPSSLVFLQDVKFSRGVIHRSKFRRMDFSWNWSFFKHGELRCESVKTARS